MMTHLYFLSEKFFGIAGEQNTNNRAMWTNIQKSRGAIPAS